jgi:hypothetical protein
MASDEVTPAPSETPRTPIRPDGRWSGKLTSRPLPSEDPAIDALPANQRALLTEVWLGRAASERRVADSFGVVRDALTALAADPALIDLAERAIDDEMRHAELSRVVASRYAGRELDAPPLLPLTIPAHKRASDKLRHVLHVVGQCSLNETIASAFLEATLAEARAPLATAALRELLSDEIDHARMGWALLASTDRATRDAVAEWLPEMAIANLRMWRKAPRQYPDDATLEAHGAPSADAVEAALLMAFRDLIIPGFEALEMPMTKVRAWLDDGAPTS